MVQIPEARLIKLPRDLPWLLDEAIERDREYVANGRYDQEAARATAIREVLLYFELAEDRA